MSEEPVDLQACEFCSKKTPIETCLYHGGIWICESCDAAWQEEFKILRHEWEPGQFFDDMGDEGRVCSKCNSFVRIEDFADVVGSPLPVAQEKAPQ